MSDRDTPDNSPALGLSGIDSSVERKMHTINIQDCS